MTNYQDLAKFRVKVLTILSSQESDVLTYGRMLEAIAKETGVDIVIGRRRDAEGIYRMGIYPVGTPVDTIPELKQIATAPLNHFNPAQPPVTSSSHFGVFYIMSDNLSDSSPLYVVALYSGRKELNQDALDTFEEMIRVIPPLFRLREDRQQARREWDRAERERRQGETELRKLFDESRDMIYTTNADDVFASINQAGITLLGAENRFELIGRHFSDFLMNHEDRDYFMKRIRDSGFLQDYEIILKDNRYCIETAHIITHEDGSFAGVQGIIKDISDRIQNEKTLWLANMELAEANQQLQKTQMALIQQEKLASIGQLAAGVAHEINNPLGFLKSNWETLKLYIEAIQRAWREAENKLSPEALDRIREKEDLDYILHELPTMFEQSGEGFSRIIEIVSQLKAFSRIDSDSKFGPYNIERGIQSTLIVANNELKYVADVKRDFGEVPTILADGGSINQVLLNLIVNAAQAIEAQGRKERGLIVISTRTEGEGIRCTVKDDGPGFDDTIKAKLFDPFFTTKEPGKGTGLGLSISYDNIVTKHHGSFSVESSPGMGASFSFWLPAVQAE